MFTLSTLYEHLGMNLLNTHIVTCFVYVSPCSLGGPIMVPQRAEDGVLETVLFSMGRTMTQEEVKHLMRRTIQQLAETLSLEEELAEHLLMHCKWNIDMLIQRYTDDPETLVLAAGLKICSPQPLPSPMSLCPVCLMPRSGDTDSEPMMLSCRHYCCRVIIMPAEYYET